MPEHILGGLLLYIWMASYYDAVRRRVRRSRFPPPDP